MAVGNSLSRVFSNHRERTVGCRSYSKVSPLDFYPLKAIWERKGRNCRNHRSSTKSRRSTCVVNLLSLRSIPGGFSLARNNIDEADSTDPNNFDIWILPRWKSPARKILNQERRNRWIVGITWSNVFASEQIRLVRCLIVSKLRRNSLVLKIISHLKRNEDKRDPWTFIVFYFFCSGNDAAASHNDTSWWLKSDGTLMELWKYDVRFVSATALGKEKKRRSKDPARCMTTISLSRKDPIAIVRGITRISGEGLIVGLGCFR